MNSNAKLAIAAFAVVIVAVVGISLLPGSFRLGGDAPATPSPSPTAAPPMGEFPPAGMVPAGRRAMVREGIPLTIEVPAGWSSNGSFWLGGGGAEIFFWSGTPDGVRADPCSMERGPVIGRSIDDLAAAVATMPGVEQLAGPDPLTIGGYPARQVTIRVPEDAPCPDRFYLWYDEDFGDRYAEGLGNTITVWIIDVNGTPIWIDGELRADALPSVVAAMPELVGSIRFGPPTDSEPSPGASGSPSAGAATPSPAEEPQPLPSSGVLELGSYAFDPLPGNVVGGLVVHADGWSSGGDNPGNGVWIFKGTPGTPGGARISISTNPLDVYADPCRHVLRGEAIGSSGDLAAAIAAIPGVDAAFPGSPAALDYEDHVVIVVRDDIPCDPADYYLWTDVTDVPRTATARGSTIRLWIPPVGHGHTFVEAETFAGASPELEREVLQIVDSVWGGG